MFVIVYKNNVILGPIKWNKFRFQEEIKDDLDIDVTLELKNDNNLPVIINNDLKILPTQGTPNPNHNPKIEFLHGPFWNFTNNVATSSYQVVQKPVEAVRNELKNVIANERWLKQNVTLDVDIDGTTYQFDTSEKTRTSLQQSLVLNAPLNWKLNNGKWVNLTVENITTILSTIATHIQSCFDWEFTKNTELYVCSTLEELDALEIVPPVEVPGLI
jgi:hypothetical protein